MQDKKGVSSGLASKVGHNRAGSLEPPTLALKNRDKSDIRIMNNARRSYNNAKINRLGLQINLYTSRTHSLLVLHFFFKGYRCAIALQVCLDRGA
jgi:hypothetical protein